MAGTFLAILVLLCAVLAGVYQILLSPLVELHGLFRDVRPIGTKDCTTVPEVQACEKIVLHQATGVLYLACSTPKDRLHWINSKVQTDLFDRTETDYVATYDPATATLTRLSFENFSTSRTVALHGMDVVPSSSDPSTLFVYLINHRFPPNPFAFATSGPESVIEIFKTTVGSSRLQHIQTVEDSSVIIMPNDVVGSSDGKTFHFTNSHSSKVSYTSPSFYLGLISATGSVGFCHVDDGCKMAITNMPSSNGIARAANDTFYVSSTLTGGLRILDKQEDNTLVLADSISTEYPLDNLSIDDDGFVWASAYPKSYNMTQHMRDYTWTSRSPSAVLVLSINVGTAAYFGEKYKLERAFEDDGSLVSGASTYVHDTRRGRLFMHGLLAPWLTVCMI